MPTWRILRGNTAAASGSSRAIGESIIRSGSAMARTALVPAPNFVPEQSVVHRAATNGDWREADRILGGIRPLMRFIRGRPGIEAHMFLGRRTCCGRTRFDSGANRRQGLQSRSRPVMEFRRMLAERLGGTE